MKTGIEERMQDAVFIKLLGILFIFLGFLGFFIPYLQTIIFIFIGIFLLIKSELKKKKRR